MVSANTVFVTPQLLGDFVHALIDARIHVFIPHAGDEGVLLAGMYDYFRHRLIGFHIERDFYRMNAVVVFGQFFGFGFHVISKRI